MDLYFNIFKIKYTVMMNLLRENPNVQISQKDTVNVFINLEPILTKMCVPKVNEQIKVDEDSQVRFISNVINIASHYKWFFTKNKISSNVYLYFPSLSSDKQKNTDFNPEYRRYYQYKFIENGDNGPLYKMIKDSIPIIQLILEYIQGVYLIDSMCIENSVIPYIISSTQQDKTYHNFIVSTSIYDIQYVNYDYFMLIPMGDDSELLDKYDAMDFIYKINKIVKSDVLDCAFLPFILSIVGSKNRNIYNVKGMGMKSTVKIIQTAVKHGLITPRTTNINFLIEIIKPAWRDTILNNFYCTDIQFQHSILSYKDIHDIESQLIDKFDNIALKKLNDEYFKNYPINLLEITASPINKNTIKF